MSDEEEDEQPTSKRAKSKNGAPTKTNAKETEPENDVDSDETGDEEEDAVDDMLKALHGGEDDSEQQKRNIDPFLVFPSVQTLLLKETGLGIEGCQSLVKTEVGLNVVSTALMQGLRQRGLTANDIKMTTSEAKSKSGSSTRLMRLTAFLRSGDGAEPALGSSTSATKETSEGHAKSLSR